MRWSSYVTLFYPKDVRSVVFVEQTPYRKITGKNVLRIISNFSERRFIFIFYANNRQQKPDENFLSFAKDFLTSVIWSMRKKKQNNAQIKGTDWPAKHCMKDVKG